jgi:AraC family transcriptional regulator
LKPVKLETAIAHQALVHRAVDRIQLELDDDEMSLDLLARRSGVSPFYFHRLFSTVVGEPPAGYVRRLRLERAALRLKYTRRPVTQIALDAGYETHEAFTRAFKAMFGKAPRQWRAAETCAGARSADPIRILHLQPRRIACKRVVGPYDGIGAAFLEMLDWAQRRGIDAQGSLVAVYFDHQSITPPDRARCEAGLFLGQHPSPFDLAGDGIEVRELAGGDHAVMHCEGSTVERRRRYDYLYGQWLPERGLVPVDSPPIEEYVPPDGDLDRLDEITNVHVRLAPGRAA